MKKQIKKWGESLIVSFDKEDQEVYGITAQSILDLSDMSVINKEGQACEDITNITSKQRNDEHGLPL